MGNKAPSGVKIDKRIEAEPVIVAGKRIQPIARIVGWEMDGDEQTGPFTSRVGRVTPVEVRVDNGDAQEVIAIDDPLQEPLRGILALSIAVSIVCTLVMLLARIGARRK